MKIALSIVHRHRKADRGSAVIVLLTFLVILVLLAAVNIATLNWLGNQVKVVDKLETQRLATAATNQVQRASSAGNPSLSK